MWFLAAAGPAGALLAGCTVPVRSLRVPGGAEARVPLDAFPELARPGGVVRVVTPEHRGVYVRAETDGTFAAVSAVCTHQGCIVDPTPEGFRCPCHGSTFGLDGRRTGGPARRELARFVAERQGGDVVLRLSQESR